MASKKQVGKKTITQKRAQEIQNYLLSINGLVNPNMKNVTIRNPIAVESTKRELRFLKDELNLYEIDIQSINLEAIYGQEERSELDSLICGLSDGLTKASYFKSYKNMVRGEALEKAYPEEERKARIIELEEEIQRHLHVVETLGEFNPSLSKSKESEINTLSQELESIKETLQLPTREYLITRLYSDAFYKLENLKEQCEYKLNYLEGVLE